MSEDVKERVEAICNGLPESPTKVGIQYILGYVRGSISKDSLVEMLALQYSRKEIYNALNNQTAQYDSNGRNWIRGGASTRTDDRALAGAVSAH